MTINELRQKRAQKLAAARAFLESNRNDNGVLSAEDDAAYTRMENEITALGNEISRMERLEAMDAKLSLPVSAPITEKPEQPAKAENQDRQSFGRVQKRVLERDEAQGQAHSRDEERSAGRHGFRGRLSRPR